MALASADIKNCLPSENTYFKPESDSPSVSIDGLFGTTIVTPLLVNPVHACNNTKHNIQANDNLQ